VIPTLVMLFLFIMPYVGRTQKGHRFNLGFVWAMLGIIVSLTYVALDADRKDPQYLASVQVARRDAERVVVLAQAPQGIPTSGAITLLRNDPLTQGPKLFAKNCASCHRFDGHDGLGGQPKDAISASDLKGFASREWLSGLLDPQRINTSHYFGGSKLKDGKMANFVKADVAEFSAAQKAELQQVIVALSAEAELKSQRNSDLRDAALIANGRKILAANSLSCVDCHKFRELGDDPSAPDLTGYGSRAWLAAFIADPAHERFYGERNDRMPQFGSKKMLTEQEIGLVVDWLRGEWYERAAP